MEFLTWCLPIERTPKNCLQGNGFLVFSFYRYYNNNDYTSTPLTRRACCGGAYTHARECESRPLLSKKL